MELVRQIRSLIRRGVHPVDGVAATEYAILLALIVLVASGTIGAIGAKFLTLYTRISDAIG